MWLSIVQGGVHLMTYEIITHTLKYTLTHIHTHMRASTSLYWRRSKNNAFEIRRNKQYIVVPHRETISVVLL